MQLRPRQKDFVSRCISALKRRRNTIGIAPTGCGKTVMLSAVASEIGGRALILQHRDELVSQNRATFKRVANGVETDLYTAGRKRWSPGATFAMVQTLSREDNLASMPSLDLLVVDEAHHVAAESYRKIIERAKFMNPDVMVFGVTATPQRGDKKGLMEVFDNVADVVQLSELIHSGFLVKPRFFVIDCCLREELSKVRVTANDFDMQQVESIMDKEVVTDRVIEEWRDKAGDRKTVVFCSTVAHAEHVMEAFRQAGVEADMVHGDLAEGERKARLRKFDGGPTQVMINVAVLTEGWDCQTVSCVVLLRPCSYKSTMIQMIGRGLRKVDPERYPGVVKSDCIVLDFGYSLATHGSIDCDASIASQKKEDHVPAGCPSCGTIIPSGSDECPICGAILQRRNEISVDDGTEREAIEAFTMREVDLMEMSPYKWQDMFDGLATMANAITAWAALVFYRDRWIAVGRHTEGDQGVRLLAVAGKDDRAVALASADDFLREHGDKDAARKTKRWLHEPASDKQLSLMKVEGSVPFGMTKYLASCHITWMFNERGIKLRVMRA